jgi:DNA-binding response OmpR family regulator
MVTVEPLRGSRILVIEDDYLIAEIVLELLTEAGATPLGPIGTVDDALAYIDTHSELFDHVILDLDLHGQKSYPIAKRLAALALPFVFVSGYSLDSIETPYRCFPHCEKPIRAGDLLGMLAA